MKTKISVILLLIVCSFQAFACDFKKGDDVYAVFTAGGHILFEVPALDFTSYVFTKGTVMEIEQDCVAAHVQLKAQLGSSNQWSAMNNKGKTTRVSATFILKETNTGVDIEGKSVKVGDIVDVNPNFYPLGNMRGRQNYSKRSIILNAYRSASDSVSKLFYLIAPVENHTKAKLTSSMNVIQLTPLEKGARLYDPSHCQLGTVESSPAPGLYVFKLDNGKSIQTTAQKFTWVVSEQHSNVVFKNSTRKVTLIAEFADGRVLAKTDGSSLFSCPVYSKDRFTNLE